MLTPGQKVGGYTLVRKLGEGGMGVVFQAIHPDIGRHVALKVLHPELAQNPLVARRFLNEARAANRVQHPGLVQVHDFGYEPDGSAYLIMEIIPGESLQERLSRGGKEHPTTALAPGLAVSLAGQIAQALAAAHAQGVIHRDIKPANVMLVADPQQAFGEQAKVLDFGVAKLPVEPGAQPGRTRSGVMIGTAEYMSPEQCRGDPDIDAATDVYALGVLLYEMLAGQRPFAAESAVEIMALHLRAPPRLLTELAPGLPPELIGFVHRMLAKQPADRPTMTGVAAELLRLLPEVRGLEHLPLPKSGVPMRPETDGVTAPDAAPFVPRRPVRLRRIGFGMFEITLAIGVALLCAFLFVQHRHKTLPTSEKLLPQAAAPLPATGPAKAPETVNRSPPPPQPSANLSTSPARRSVTAKPAASKRRLEAKTDTDDLPFLLRPKEPAGP